MILTIIISVLFFVCAFVVFMGKGDWMIAGYNTSSNEEKEAINIKRLRLVVGGTLCVSTAAILIPVAFYNPRDIKVGLGVGAAILVVSFIAVILANTWCKKK